MEYRIEDLASIAGETVDTIRYYQARGLLERPRRQGRTAIYCDDHVAALRQIRDYQAQGFPLALIERLLHEDGTSTGAALLSAVSAESGARKLTRAQLAAESGVPEALLGSLHAAGLLVPLNAGEDGGDELYAEADVQMAKAGLDLLSQGFPLDELLALAVRHARGIESVCDSAIELFDQHVRQVDHRGDEPPGVADTFRTLLPAVTTLVAVHFQRTLLQRALQRLREVEEGATLDAAVAAVETGKLEVKWT